jgi:hypothetical protein
MFVAGEAPVLAVRKGRPMPRENREVVGREGAAAPAGLELQLGRGARRAAHGPTAWRAAGGEKGVNRSPDSSTRCYGSGWRRGSGVVGGERAAGGRSDGGWPVGGTGV